MRKILIVEDDILLNRTLGYNLASDGYEVTAAYNYKEAVSHLKAIEFDIALLDINLPDGSGVQKGGGGLCQSGTAHAPARSV